MTVRIKDLQIPHGHATSAHMFRRRTLLLAAAACLPLSLPVIAAPGAKLSPQDQADAARIEAYLNSVKSLKARFSQVAGDGGVSQGNRLA